MPAAVWKNLQCLQSIDGEIVLAFLHASIFFIGCLIFALERVWRRFFARCALHFAGKLFFMCSGAFGAWGKVCLAYAREKLYNGKMDEKIRINKYLSEAGFCSRREADSLIRNGRVTVEGHVAEPGERITTDTVVFVDGKPVKKVEKKVLLLFHKPRGVVCSTRKQRQETTVTEYLNYPVRIYPIGRLDKESEGLLLLTNQGDLVNKIMRAGNYHEKEYLVTVNKQVDSDFVKKMSSGIPILDTITRPCFVEKTGRNSFRIILTQGLNRQIRRMCEYLGYQVLSLKRVRIMELTIDGLKEGGYREATQEEWKKLERGIADSSQLPAARRQDSVPVFSKKQGRDSIPFSSIPEEKRQNKPAASRTISEKRQSVSQRKSACSNYNSKTGGHHGKFSTANERTGRKAGSGREGILPGRQGNHEQSGVRQPVRPAGAAGKRNRHCTHK